MSGKTIHLVFKTHLDIGFTNLAARVRRQYHEQFIPQAIETGEHFFREDPAHPRFIWTTGAWLIWDHLEGADAAGVKRLEQAIERGLIRWHALPFTMHSELMSPELFRAGLNHSQELDERFGLTTIAAKMTDVPGHTRGIVPLLAEAGVKFLHLGVNEASPVPDVPEIFRWRAPAGEEVLVMYQNSYGGTHFPEGSTVGLSFAHTNDNAGPQGISQVADVYRHLQTAHPDAAIAASTLDAYGTLLWAEREKFPLVESEIGDSWIYGAASDPGKVSRFLALQRLYGEFASEYLTPRRLSFGRGLAMVAEHTWGVDIKTFLRDELAWDRPAFEAARRDDYRFGFVEASWQEQRDYIDTAIGELDATDQQRAADTWPPAAAVAVGADVTATGEFALDGWSVAVDSATGDVTRLGSPGGTEIDGIDGSLLGFRYESYDATDIAAHLDSYLTRRPDWAFYDHAKPGLERSAAAVSQRWLPAFDRITRGGDSLQISATMPPPAVDGQGAPRTITLELAPIDDLHLAITLSWRGKAANRMPEASFLCFAPVGASEWSFQKMGLWQAAENVAPLGGGQLQAVRAARATLGGTGIEIAPLDTPLVAPRDTPFMVFDHAPPRFTSGIRFNLHNNKWGTNFPMWWDGDFTARFVLSIAPQ